MLTLDRFHDGKKLILTMSYDDGNIADRRLVEIFNKYGIRGSFHLNSGRFDANNAVIKSDEVKTLYKNHEVAVHTANHTSLIKLTPATAAREVIDDRKNLESLCGYVVRGMSYPYGTYNDEVISILKNCGIVYSRVVASTMNFSLPEDFMRWEPTGHHKFTPEIAEKFLNLINSKTPYPALCYIWGHSYEFDKDNNWDLIEDFCKKVGGFDNVWYATNIEIYDYLTAQKALHISADESIVHNPTQIDVWISKDGESVKIPSGETVYF